MSAAVIAESSVRGPAVLYVLGAIGVLAFPALHLWDIPMSTFYGATALLGGGIAVQYSRLTVRVTAEGVQWRLALTPGWHRIPASDLAGAEPVDLGTRRGIGTRLTTVGTLHNVGAPIALRIRRVKNEDLLLGTNDPEEIIRAIDVVRPR